jgi:hypothetical protein
MRFVPGVELSRRYFRDVVEPVLAREFPALRYSAALIGNGSEVLGFDTPMSTDHNWGPRVLLFFSPENQARGGHHRAFRRADTRDFPRVAHPHQARRRERA